MNGQFTIGALSPARYFSFISVTLGLLFAFIGESDAESVGMLLNLARWQLQVAVPMALLIGSHLVLQKVGIFERLGPWMRLSLSGLVGASLATGPALLIELWVSGQSSSTEVADGVLLAEFVDLAPPVIVAWVAINAPWLLGFRVERYRQPQRQPEDRTGQSGETRAAEHAVPATSASQPDALPGFMALLPKDVRGEPIYLKSELHYLLVVTPSGKGLILYTLRDAMAELNGLRGLHPHRSYWVNSDYIKNLTRSGREAELVLTDGSKIPVSRYRVAEIRQAIEGLKEAERSVLNAAGVQSP